jgi:hypothetical protein
VLRQTRKLKKAEKLIQKLRNLNYGQNKRFADFNLGYVEANSNNLDNVGADN